MSMERKHPFTQVEKREFLRILKKYSSIVETKANDGNTSRRKSIAWNRIACEYNTSPINPYPASCKQLRKLWFNLKVKQKQMAVATLEETFERPYPRPSIEDSLEATDVEEEINTPYFVNVHSGENQDDSIKAQISGGNNQENESFTLTDNEGRAFDVEFIEDMEDEKPVVQHSPEDKEVKRVKNNLLVREYQDRRRRLNELHQLQKRLLMEQLREARAKANLAEVELRQNQYLQ